MAQNVLFLVTGMTPQIITETVWALACDPNNNNPWIPDEIYVLSTDDGLNQIRSRLFSEKEGYKFEKFKQEYPQLRHIEFDNTEKYLITIQRDGVNLKDLKTPEDNEAAADEICNTIREFTEQNDVALHVSIAGGRKTMGFYAGYALSLYGRAQDRMSHVLVEERYESARDFFYPSADETVFVTNRDGIELKAKDAQIWLAEIPFVRMREAIVDKHELKNKVKFSEVVQKINASFGPIKLSIDSKNQRIYINDGAFIIDNLPAREFAMLHWFASLRKQGLDGIIAPTESILNKEAKVEDIQHILQLSAQYRQYYDVLKLKDEFHEDSLKTVDVDKRFFEVVKSRLKSALEESLGLELANKLQIKQDKRGQPFYLDLEPNMIELN